MFRFFFSLIILVVSLSASQASILPPYVPPLPRPETAAREDNRLVPGPLRGPYDYQGGHLQRLTSKGWAARYVDQVWGEEAL